MWQRRCCNACKLLVIVIITAIIHPTQQVAPQRIPPILHHIFLSGKAAYETETRKPGAVLSEAWRASCMHAYPGWQHMFWTQQDALAFIQQHYPWFEKTWTSFDHFVLRGDALRYLVLHAMGGVYLDLDIECFADAAQASLEALEGYDVVLQGHREEEPLINAMMASAPGHPIFEAALHEIVARSDPDVMAKYTDANIRVLYTVGPRMFGDVVGAYLAGGASPTMAYHTLVAAPHIVNGTVVRVYDVGAWYQPCTWDDCWCHKRLALAQLTGRHPPGVVGLHHFTSTWASEMGRDHRRCRMQQDAYVLCKVGRSYIVHMLHVYNPPVGCIDDGVCLCVTVTICVCVTLFFVHVSPSTLNSPNLRCWNMCLCCWPSYMVLLVCWWCWC